MHKGYVRRTIFLWGSSLIWVLLGIFFFSGTVKGYIGGESLYKAGDIYHLNDAGTSVAIRVLDIDSEPLTYDGNDYYLVKHENGVTPLQVKVCQRHSTITRLEERESRGMGAFKRIQYLFKCSCNASSDKRA